MCVYYIIGVGGCVTGWTGYRENVTRSETKIKMTRPHTLLENLNSTGKLFNLNQLKGFFVYFCFVLAT